MSYCAAYNCKKRNGVDECSVRNFIRFYKFPLDKTGKPTSMTRIWVSRIDREFKHINFKSMRICSDHFSDEDFEQKSFYRTTIQPPGKWKGTRILLKPDAVPNTIRASGERRLPRPTAANSEAANHSDTVYVPILHLEELEKDGELIAILYNTLKIR